MATVHAAEFEQDTRPAHAPREERADLRWAGIALALSAFTFPVTIFLYVFAYGQPTGTGAGGEVTLQDSATYMLERWWFISKVWIVEAMAMVLLAVAGFALQRRSLAGPAWFPARVGWIMVGIAALLQTAMYAFMLGGYPFAATGEGALALYGAMKGSAAVLFNLSNAVLYLGLAGALFAESSPAGALPRWLAYAGAGISLVVAALMVGLVWGVGQMMMAAPGALAGYLLAGYLGIALWRRG